MKIIDMKLTNFQGIGSLDISLDGKSASIFGDNGTGKTTVFNAITWLLFDKPSTGAKNWSPKTRGADGEKHNLEHSVTATFVLQDGSRVTLGKTLREVYKKKRGSTSAEYSGNTVDYFLDGVPVKERRVIPRRFGRPAPAKWGPEKAESPCRKWGIYRRGRAKVRGRVEFYGGLIL